MGRIPKPIAKAGAWVQDQFVGQSFIKPWMVDRADDHYALDITRAKQVLGWNPEHRLREALPEIVENLRNDPARWYRENHLQAPPAVKRSA